MLESASFASSPASDPPRSDSPYRATASDQRHLVWMGALASVTLDSTTGRDLVETDFGDSDMRVLCSESEVRISQAGSFWTRALDTLLFGFDPDPRARVSLHRDHQWSVECRGGVSELDARLEDVRLADLTIRGGVSLSYLELGPPRGRARVRISGGVSHLEIRRPPQVGLRLRVRGGISHLTFDAMELESIGGKLALTSDDFSACTNFYDVEISGGASDLVLTTR